MPLLGRLVLLAVLAVAGASLVQARSGQNPDGGSATGGAGGVCSPTGKVVLFTALSGYGGGLGTAPQSSVTTAATAGAYACHLVQAPCSGSFTKIGCFVVTGSSTAVSECGLFTATGSARIASTGAISTPMGFSAGQISATVSAFTLTSGTQYLACWASGDLGAQAVTYRTPGTPSGVNNLFVNTTFSSGTGATQVAPYNANCSGFGNPYTCCTGAQAGTCLGMADRTGIQGFVANAVIGPSIVVAP